MLFVFLYVYWCPTRFTYQLVIMSFNSNTTGVTCGAGTASFPEHTSSTLISSCVRVAQTSVFCLLSCQQLFCPLDLSSLAIVLSVLRFTVSWYRQSFLRNISPIMFTILCSRKKNQALIKAECPYI